MASSRGTERFGHIIADRLSFTKTGDGLQLPDGFTAPVDPAEVAAAVEEYLLQLPGSGPNTHLTMNASGDLVWAAIA